MLTFKISSGPLSTGLQAHNFLFMYQSIGQFGLKSNSLLSFKAVTHSNKHLYFSIKNYPSNVLEDSKALLRTTFIVFINKF